MIALVLNNQRSLLLEDADYDGHSLSMLQKIAGALSFKRIYESAEIESSSVNCSIASSIPSEYGSKMVVQT